MSTSEKKPITECGRANSEEGRARLWISINLISVRYITSLTEKERGREEEEGRGKQQRGGMRWR